jgi:hypothetical protein
MMSLTKKEVIVALREERAGLKERIDAIDAALKAFGALNPAHRPRTRKSPENGVGVRYEETIVEFLRKTSTWSTAKEIADNSGLEVNGNLHNALRRLSDAGDIDADRSSKPARFAVHP